MLTRTKLWGVVTLVGVLAFTACGSDGGDDAASPAAEPATGSASVSDSPAVDPMTVARLDGVYDVVKKVVAQKNFTDIKVGDSFTRTYDVTLDCDTGPCGGTVKIDAEESKGIQKQTVTYDEATHTYGFDAPVGSVTCTGVDGKTYDLETTNIFTLTPTKTEASGSEFIVSKFTAEATLKGVPHGAAQKTGKCRVSTAEYEYTGHLAT